MTLRNILRGADDQLFVEDVFSTFLYTGNGSTQTITNGIDLAGRGGLVWIKDRDSAVFPNILFDTARGTTVNLKSDSSDGSGSATTQVTAFNSNGFALGNSGTTNNSGARLASWTFRRAPKFFDVVTYTGNGANRTIAHSLGAVPGMIIVKRTDSVADWQVYHRSLANTDYVVLNTTAASATGATRWNSTTATSSVFSLGTDTTVNASGGTYVAYLFAHDATANGIVQCGSYTGNGTSGTSSQSITLGWEPQFIIIKQYTLAGDQWVALDTMRGTSQSSGTALLFPNSSDAEDTTILPAGDGVQMTATGFTLDGNASRVNANGRGYIYLAIRRGPMRRPTAGTQVFTPLAFNQANNTSLTVGFPIDLSFAYTRGGGDGSNTTVVDRLRGFPSTNSSTGNQVLVTASTGAEYNDTAKTYGWDNTGAFVGTAQASANVADYFFRRAPGFFDVVCYTGTGGGQTVPHNLGVVPELSIFKSRSGAFDWAVRLNNGQEVANLNTTGAFTGTTFNAGNNTASLLTTRTVENNGLNAVSATYVAYLFASLPGVSKIGTYTGNGSTTGPIVSTGFQPRFLLVKRTDSTGNWVVWDSARDGTNPRSPVLFLNSTAAETTSGYDVDFNASDFQLKSTNTDVNANSGTYLYFACA